MISRIDELLLFLETIVSSTDALIDSYCSLRAINSILSNLNVSIPQIYERYDKYYTLIMEDFGELRFDKIFSLYPIKDLLQYAVQNLVLFKNEIKISSQHKLKKCNFLSLKNEISELTDYYYIYSFTSNYIY